MNTGIDDIANLAWKLAGTIQGWGGSHLIESYDTERRPVGYRNTKAASEIADILGAFPVPAEIEQSGDAGLRAREQVREAIGLVAIEEFGTVGVQLGVRYECSPLIIADGTPAPIDSRTQYEPTARPGSRLPHFLLADRTSVFDKLGTGFTLLDFSGDLSRAGDFAAVGAGRGVSVTHLPIDARLRPTVIGADYVMVRPDWHVAWRGDRLPDDANAFFDKVLGWLA